MKKVLVVLIYITAPLLVSSQTADKIESLGLDNLHRIDSGVYRSEQPKSEQFKVLGEYGIKEVISLRYWNSNKKYYNDNKDIVFHRVRMNAHNINDYDVVKALKIIKNRKGPILIHCQHGSDRTGAIVAMYRIVFQNWSKEEAIKELKSEKYGFHKVYLNVPLYIENADIDLLRKQLQD